MRCERKDGEAYEEQKGDLEFLKIINKKCMQLEKTLGGKSIFTENFMSI